MVGAKTSTVYNCTSKSLMVLGEHTFYSRMHPTQTHGMHPAMQYEVLRQKTAKEEEGVHEAGGWGLHPYRNINETHSGQDAAVLINTKHTQVVEA